jgi:hypothetical protein
LITPEVGERRETLPAVLRYLVEQAEHAIDRADAKAGALAAAALAVLPLLVGRTTARQIPPARAGIAEGFFALGALGWGAGILALAAAVMPRLKRDVTDDGRLSSIYDIPAELDLDRLRAQIDRVSVDTEEFLLVQSHVLSRIAVTKYSLIRLSMPLLAAGASFGLFGVLVS